MGEEQGEIPLVHLHLCVDANRREIALGEELVELLRTRNGSHEDDNLVEVERIKQVVQLAVLLCLLELDIVLLETVKRQLALVVHINLHGLHR